MQTDVPEEAQLVEDNKKKNMTTHTDERVEKLWQIIGSINSCEPDGEINTLCEKAYVELNTLTTYGQSRFEEGVKAERDRVN